MKRNRVRNRMTALFALVAGLSVLSACGDDGVSVSEQSTSGGHSLAGEPFRVGWLNAETGGFAFPEATRSANAAVDYVNTNGGIDGRPLELISCASDGTPATETSCANKFVAEKVPFVLLGLDAGVDAAVSIYAEAKLPLVVGTTVAPGIEAETNNVLLVPPIDMIPRAIAAIFKEIGSDNVTFIYPKVGPVIEQLYKLVETALDDEGIDSTLTLVDPANPDVTTAITAAQAAGSDGLFFSFGEDQCTNVVRTATSLGWDGSMLAGSCSGFIKDLGAQAAGVHTLQSVFPYAARAEAEAYDSDLTGEFDAFEKALSAAGEEDLLQSAWAEYAFSTVMTFVEIAQGVEGDLTTEKLRNALKTFQGSQFLGLPQDCTTPLQPGGTCGRYFLGLEVNPDGTQSLVPSEPIDLTQYASN